MTVAQVIALFAFGVVLALIRSRIDAMHAPPKATADIPTESAPTNLPTTEIKEIIMPTPTPIPTNTPAPPALDVAATLAGMTLKQKAGHVLMIDMQGMTGLNHDWEVILEDLQPGGVFFFEANIPSAQSLQNFTNALQEHALRMTGLPLLLALDHEGGLVNRLWDNATRLPPNMAIAATDSPNAYAARAAKVLADELGAMGINLTFGPVVDVNNNPANPVIGARSFGSDPGVVAALGARMIYTYKQEGMISVAKHFPGHGDTAVDSHTGLPTITHDRARLDAVELVPFRAAIAAGVPAVMSAHIIFPAIDPDHPATLSRSILTGLLRDELGFEGVIMTDALGMAAIQTIYGQPEAAVLALKAGADLITADHNSAPGNLAIRDAIVEAVQTGDLPLERLDDAVTRVLTLKAEYGLFDWKPKSPEDLAESVKTPEHEAFAAELARRAITVVRDSGGLLPVEGSVIVLGPDRLLPYEVEAPDVTVIPYAGNPTGDQIAEMVRTASGAGRVILFLEPGRYAMQEKLARALMERGDVVLVAMRSPYDVLRIPEAGTWAVTYYPGRVSLEAALDVIRDKYPAVGTLPIELPGMVQNLPTME